MPAPNSEALFQDFGKVRLPISASRKNNPVQFSFDKSMKIQFGRSILRRIACWMNFPGNPAEN
jgi:hypothetical protein